MAKMQFDALDIGMLVLTVMMGFIVVGIGSFDLFGVDFTDPLTTVGGYTLSTAWVLAAGSFVGTIVTNNNTELSTFRNDVSNLEQNYVLMVVGTIALLVSWIFVPQVSDFFQSADLWGLIYVMLVTGGQLVVGWVL